MLSRFAILFILFVFLPLGAHAAATSSLPAGFAEGSIWLSKTSLTEGDSVKLYTVVYNSSAEAIAGAAVFLVDGTSIASSTFTIDAGVTAIESAKWVAKAGSHTFKAEVENVVDASTKEPVELASASTPVVSVNVAALPPPPPPPAPVETNIAQSAGASASSSSSGSFLSSVYSTTEDLRQSGVVYLTGLLKSATSSTASSASSTTPAPQILGTSTSKAAQGGFLTALERMLLFIFNAPLLFYALLILILVVVFCLFTGI